MTQLGGNLDLTQEALVSQRRREIGVQHLDGHETVVLEVARQVDRGHATGAELVLDLVTVSQSGC